MNTIKIRKAIEKDIDEIISLCSEHAKYEGAGYSSEGKAQKLLKFLFSDSPDLYCLIAEHDEKIAGYTTYMPEFSTWDAEHYIHMDCLYIREEFRGLGIGRRFINEIAKDTHLKGCSLIQWQTPASNTKAIEFYNKLGAKSKEKIRFFLNREFTNQILS